jgi:hypothetical protein
MYSAKVSASQSLYGKLNQFLAHAVPHSVQLASRSDYRDPTLLKITLDYGKYQIEMKEHDLKLQVEHRPPSDSESEAVLVLVAQTFEMNMKLVNLALSAVLRSPDERVVPVFAWDNGWHQKQAVWVADHKPSKTQLKVIDDITWFYGNSKWHTEKKIPFQRGLMVSGPSSSGKHWCIRNLALQNAKSLAYIPVTEHTYGVIGPALACAPLNSIIVMDNIAQFFGVIPTHERGVFMRHLETAFNTSANDPRGLLIVALLPAVVPPELEKFLRMPHRFQKKFELSISGVESLTTLISSNLPKLPTSQVDELAKQCGKVGVPENVLTWFFANLSFRDPPLSDADTVSELQSLIQKQKEERAMVDAPIGSRERLYS